MKPEEKAKKFLRDVMGQDTYNKFIKEGKIEIESGGCTYELTIGGTVINKTKNQKYCVILAPGMSPDVDDIPSFDILAIKYAWLKYGTKTVETVANKTNLFNDHEIEPGRGGAVTYSEFVRHMEAQGWARETLTIQEHDDSIASTENVNAGEIGSAIQIRAPAGGIITIMGIRQVPRAPESAHRLVARLADDRDDEINPETQIEIVKISPSEQYRRVDRLPYAHISPTKNNLYTEIERKDSEYYTFREGIHLSSNDTLRVDVINPDKDVKSVKFGVDMDLWLRRCTAPSCNFDTI